MVEKAADKGGEEKGKKSSLFKWVIMAVLVIGLSAGGYYGYTTYFSDGFSLGGSSRSAPPVIHPLDSFLVNLSDPGGKRYLKVNMELELEDQGGLVEVKERNHAVRDSILLLLSGKVYDDISSPAGKLTLKREIISRLNRVLSSGQVKEVYFTEFLVQ